MDMLSYKTNVSEACKETGADAMEAIGGQSFFKKNVLERLFRDMQAFPLHPLPKGSIRICWRAVIKRLTGY